MDFVATSGVIVVEDNLECRGLKFLLSLFKTLSKSFDKALAICDEINSEHVEKLLSADELSKTEVLSYNDFCLDDEPKQSKAVIIQQLISKCEEKLKSTKSVLILDSLTPFLVHFGCDKTIQWLHNVYHSESTGYCINSSKITVITLIHNDCANNEEINKLQWLATTWYQMEWCEKTSSVTLNAKVLKTSGEICRKSFKLTVTDDFTFKFNPLDSVDVKTTNNISSNQQTLSINNKQSPQSLTFNVGIKETEMVAKKNLLLPYVKTHNEKETGKVIYFADKEDDIDEEDPDDDLDF